MSAGLYKRTKRIRKKISKRMMGNKNGLGWNPTKEQRHKISNGMIGNKNGLGCKWNLTEETKRKMSKAMMGNKNSLEYKRTKATRLKMSRAQSGNNHPNWQGGISFEPYSIEFNIKLKRQIRERDNNICRLCDKRKYRKELSVHHVDYNKKNCKESNLIALCRGCNVKVNYNKNYWFAYFKFLMEKRNEKKSYHN